jgi:wobble nucleotide-excising tRNase
MVVNATNSRRIYTQLQTACPNSNLKSFSPILSLPPTINERRELVSRWNRSLHYLLRQLHSSIDTLDMKFIQQITTDICSNSKYAIKSNQCTQIDKQTTR